MIGRAMALCLAFLLAGCVAYEGSPTGVSGHSNGPQTYDQKSVGNTPDSFGYSMSAGNKSTLEQYDWENGASRAVIGLSGHVQQGSLTLTIKDTAGLVVYAQTFTGSDSQGVYSERGIPGEWQIELQFEDYTGSLSLGISAHYG